MEWSGKNSAKGSGLLYFNVDLGSNQGWKQAVYVTSPAVLTGYNFIQSTEKLNSSEFSRKFLNIFMLFK